MQYLTESLLKSLGFSISWVYEHGYHTQYIKYDKEVNHALILISQTSCAESIKIDDEPEVFSIWFWGPSASDGYAEVDSKMSVSTMDELKVLLDCLEY